jgi:DNA mismatch repair protein MutH
MSQKCCIARAVSEAFGLRANGVASLLRSAILKHSGTAECFQRH